MPDDPTAKAKNERPSSSGLVAKEPADLAGVAAADYGDDYRAHLLEQYKLYVQMADKISERRQAANNYGLTIHTALVTVVAALLSKQPSWLPSLAYVVVSACGIVLCFTWRRMVRSYKDLNSGKFKVIHEIEKLLPIRPYDCEWTMVGRGKVKDLYLPFSHVEGAIPLIFATLYAVTIVLVIVHGTL